MIGLAAAALLLTPASPGADGRSGPLSVVVHASGARDVRYAIDVHNTTDRAVPDAVITQQLPPGLDYRAATPPPHRTGHRHLTWTLTIPAHGTARIVTSTVGAAPRAPGHRLGARPLVHVTPADVLRHGGREPRPQPATTVCAREDAGPPTCATGRGALRTRARALSHWTRTALAIGGVGGAVAAAAWCGGTWARRRRRAAGAMQRAGVEH